MSANDSEHFARESRSPPGTPFKKPHPKQLGWGFLLLPWLPLLALPERSAFLYHQRFANAAGARS